MTCFDRWHLAADPFADGLTELEPQKTPPHLLLYQDVYTWWDENVLKGLRPGGAFEVCNISSGEMVTLVVSGAAGSGRSSLRNLLLWHIQQRAAGKQPIVADYVVPVNFPLSGQAEQSQAAMDLTSALYDAFEAVNGNVADLVAVVEKLRARYGTMPVTPATQLLGLRNELNTSAPGVPIVFCIDARGANVNQDAAKAVCGMLKPLAHYAILSMTNANAAGLVRDYFARESAPAAWVDAPLIDKARLTKFLLARLGAARLKPPPREVVDFPLRPFSQPALDELFSRPAGTATNTPVAFSLRHILSEVSALVAHKITKWVGGEVGPFEITDQDVRDYRSTL